MLKLDEGGLSYLLLRGNIGCVRDCLSAVCFLVFSNRIFSIFICLNNHFQFSLQPVDNPLRIDMVLHLFGLLLDALLETIILTLQQEDLPVKLIHALDFCLKLLTSNLRVTFHVCFHRDVPLMKLLKVFLLIFQLLNFAGQLITYFR